MKLLVLAVLFDEVVCDTTTKAPDQMLFLSGFSPDGGIRGGQRRGYRLLL